MHEQDKLDYVEFPSRNVAATKTFFGKAFGWTFTDYGPDYAAFANQGLDGGFFKSDKSSLTSNGAALLVFYSKNLAATQAKVESAEGSISRPIFTFPGGRRFQFIEPGGNEFAVWSEA